MVSQNHIETVIFDLDGTLRHNVPSADETIYSFAVELGAPDSRACRREGARWAHYYWAQSSELFEDVKKFVEMEKPFWINYCQRYLKTLGMNEQRAGGLAPKLAQMMAEGFDPQNSVIPGALETLQSLRDAGFTLGLISNRSNPCQEECRELGLLPYFEFAYVAAEVGIWKPDPGIFDRALEVSGSPPERTLYIGDNYYADVIGAQRAAIHPVLFDPDDVFPYADCTVIRSIGELSAALIPR
jgi:HAD superfamily hydrolase (TIGR01549 family)